MLNNDDTVDPVRDDVAESLLYAFHITRVEPPGRFIEDEHGSVRLRLCKRAHDSEALDLAAAERVERATES
jgi:hypothetical protein